MLALYDAAIAHFLAGEPIAPDLSLPQGVQLLVQSLATPANLPFARELWTADVSITLRVYAHDTPDMRQAAVQVMDALFGEEVPMS